MCLLVRFLLLVLVMLSPLVGNLAFSESLPSSQKIKLWYQIINNLDKQCFSKNNSENSPQSAQLLADYNQLRVLFNLEPVASFAQIDNNWLEDAELQIWKERLDEEPQSRNQLSTASQQNQATTLTPEEREDKQLTEKMAKALGFVTQSLHTLKVNHHVLVAYNFLRQKMGKSLIRNAAEIDKAWLARIDYPIWKEYFKSTLDADENILEALFAHPTDFERALYLTGFLVDKGLDINAAMREWESAGKCVDAEKYYAEKKTSTVSQLNF